MIENRSDKKLRILETSERRGEVSKIAAGRTEPEKALPRPDPEVPAKATRRRFSARYKLRVLEQADGHAKSRAKWEHYCAEKDFTGRICRPGDANARTERCRH